MTSVFLLSRSTHRGNLRSAGISRFFARPLRLSGSHHSRRGHPTPSFYIGHGTRVLPLRLIPQELLDRRSPGYLPAVAWLDAVLDPGVSALHSSLPRSPLGLLLFEGDRHSPNIQYSRGYVSDSGLHPSPRHTRLSSFPACAFSHYATERLTNPYSGGPGRLRRIPSQQATIARSPQTVFNIDETIDVLNRRVLQPVEWSIGLEKDSRERRSVAVKVPDDRSERRPLPAFDGKRPHG